MYKFNGNSFAPKQVVGGGVKGVWGYPPTLNHLARASLPHYSSGYHKHPLQNSWTLWYLEKDPLKAWQDMQNKVATFDTVEDFWNIYDNIKPPSEINMGGDYSMFKSNIRPMWEDPANRYGGRWVVVFPKDATADLDRFWLDVLLCMIGEAFWHSDEVCGAVVNIRKNVNKVSLWTAHGCNTSAIMEIGGKLRLSVELENTSLRYVLHKDTMLYQGFKLPVLHHLP